MSEPKESLGYYLVLAVALVLAASGFVWFYAKPRCRPVALAFVDGYGLYSIDDCGKVHNYNLDGNER